MAMRPVDVSSSVEPPPQESFQGSNVTRLTSGWLLAGNALWNVAGVGLPAIVAVFCLPILKNALGTDRLGVISLAWVVVGYFSVFDFGMSRALTKLVSERLGSAREAEIPSLVWTGLSLMTALGLLGGMIAFLISPVIVNRFVKVPPYLHSETLTAFHWLSVSIPIVIVTAALRGVLEALQRFRMATAIRVPMGIFTFLGPVVVLPFSHSLVAIVAVLTLGRFLACLAHLWACFIAWPDLRHHGGFGSQLAKSMLHFGGWMTVTNIVGPMMVTFDRFALGALISVSAVAYYSVPAEIVTRLLFLPITLTGVMFPAFSTAHALDRNRVSDLFDSTLKYMFIIVFPVSVMLVGLASEGLHFWLGADFAQNSTRVVQYLAIAVFVNSLAHVPFAYLQGIGRPDLTAKLHLVELPLYIAGLWVLVKFFGIKGAALAWLLRVALDALLLFWLSAQKLPRSEFLKTIFPLQLAGALAMFAACTIKIPFAEKAVLLPALCGAFFLFAWRSMLSPRERLFLQTRFGGNDAQR
ncbi:MAG TPA: flippase [Candidatus Angelobacter sp.]|nr:flippase [Candidatus Angelobacter sp.]